MHGGRSNKTGKEVEEKRLSDLITKQILKVIVNLYRDMKCEDSDGTRFRGAVGAVDRSKWSKLTKEVG